jgi:hypothetical protein
VTQDRAPSDLARANLAARDFRAIILRSAGGHVPRNARPPKPGAKGRVSGLSRIYNPRLQERMDGRRIGRPSLVHPATRNTIIGVAGLDS